MYYEVSIGRISALRARGAREAGFFFSWINFICQDGYLILFVYSSKSRFETAYVVNVTRFCKLRARGACEAGFFFMI